MKKSMSVPKRKPSKYSLWKILFSILGFFFLLPFLATALLFLIPSQDRVEYVHNVVAHNEANFLIVRIVVYLVCLFASYLYILKRTSRQLAKKVLLRITSIVVLFELILVQEIPLKLLSLIG